MNELITKTIDINKDHYIKILYHDNDNVRRLYQLKTIYGDTLVESFNRDAFLLKASKKVKISTKIECLVASV